MSVVHLSTNDVWGGAAKAAYRLHQGLRAESVQSSMFVRNKRSKQDHVVEFRPSDSFFAKCQRAFRYVRIRRDFFPRYVSRPGSTGTLMSDDRSRFAGEVVDQLPAANILNLHWVAEFVDIPNLFRNTDVPIVWTLHDMNPLTGGCHYSFRCRRFEKKCGICPRIDSDEKNDPSRKSWKRKRTAFREKINQNKLHVVAPSTWLAREARKSTLLGGAPIHHIPYGLDHTRFRPRSSQSERSRLGISDTRKIILFVAHSSTDPRKGFHLLIKALKNANLSGVTLVSIGSSSPVVPNGITHVHAGHIDDEEKLSVMYSMADVFVIPSLQDNLPNTVLESMACGTPVVGFKSGGIPEMVRAGETGWLTEKGNIRELRQAIETSLEDDTERKKMSTQCRRVIAKEYTIKRQARSYKSMYSALLSQN
ncbi:glycosyltransferase family 4 protein [Salinibacter ruber]|uniref:Glycosyltransferase involved in cell wall biosynthesis n=1 Tax=Salinibacter ruber TaxID=146919 RepID=A0AAW5P922_9BACT|nr:glycosyltransferase involved in cell wall biosynthesis [Salinibacter ruber]